MGLLGANVPTVPEKSRITSYNVCYTKLLRFQRNTLINSADIQNLALEEFEEMVRVLIANGVDVVVVKDTFEPHTPDSIFPNNWVSFHGEGQVVLYPMFAENRRLERRKDILDFLNEQHCGVKNIDDFTFWEEQNLFLEGTGSMVLDRVNRIAVITSYSIHYTKLYDPKEANNIVVLTSPSRTASVVRQAIRNNFV